MLGLKNLGTWVIMIRIVLPLMTGFEEIEAVTVIDILRRAGIEVVTAGVHPNPIIGGHGIAIFADVTLDQITSDCFAGIVLPGGAGTKFLREDHRIQQLVMDLYQQGKLTAAICAAPTVLSDLGLLRTHQATSYPAVRDALDVLHYSEEPVVQDGHVITSRGAGTAIAFALALVTYLVGATQAKTISQAICFSES